MPQRVFVAIDQRESRHSVVQFTARLAADSTAAVQVFHGIEFVGRGCAAPLETRAEAELVVEESVFELRMSGVGAGGNVRACFSHDLSRMIVAEAICWGADVIVLGGRRGRKGRGRSRVLGRGVRERVVSRSPLPVVVAPLGDQIPVGRSRGGTRGRRPDSELSPPNQPRRPGVSGRRGRVPVGSHRPWWRRIASSLRASAGR